MKKVMAVVSSDWHCHNFKNFDKDGSRLNWTLNAGDVILDTARRLKVPHFFCGDLIHSPKEAENETITKTFNLFASNADVNTYAISGNHDMSEKNGGDFVSPSWLDLFKYQPYINNMHKFQNQYVLVGINYHNDNNELLEVIKKSKVKTSYPKILMLHTDMPGAQTPAGIEVDEAYAFKGKDLDKLFKDWDLVLCGHIHKPARLSEKVYMIGSPIQQITSDEGTSMGFWLLYEDLTMEFTGLSNFPKFISLKKDEKPFNDLDYFIPYEDDFIDSDTPENNGLFHINKNRRKLAKNYMQYKAIKSKSKTKALVKILNEIE